MAVVAIPLTFPSPRTGSTDPTKIRPENTAWPLDRRRRPPADKSRIPRPARSLCPCREPTSRAGLQVALERPLGCCAGKCPHRHRFANPNAMEERYTDKSFVSSGIWCPLDPPKWAGIRFGSGFIEHRTLSQKPPQRAGKPASSPRSW